MKLFDRFFRPAPVRIENQNVPIEGCLECKRWKAFVNLAASYHNQDSRALGLQDYARHLRIIHGITLTEAE